MCDIYCLNISRLVFLEIKNYFAKKLYKQLLHFMIDWSENLPDKCPPQDAFAPNGNIFYRLSKSGKIKEDEFLSHKFLYPDKKFNNISECIKSSLSVFDDINQCRNLMNLPTNKKYKDTIALMKFNITNNDGLILKTFTDPNHYSWWRTKSFSFKSVELVK